MSGKSKHVVIAFRMLKVAFSAGLILLGLTKLVNLNDLDWSQYLSSGLKEHFACSLKSFFVTLGILEIVLGLGVIVKPYVFGSIIAGFFFLVMINFLAIGMYTGDGIHAAMIMLSALALASLSQQKS